MGRVRTKTVKKSSRVVIERYYSRMTLEQEDPRRGRNHPIQAPPQQDRRILHPPHEADPMRPRPRHLAQVAGGGERERRMDFVPDESAIKTDVIEVDKETIDMLAALGMADLPGVVKQADPPASMPTFSKLSGGFAARRL